MHVNVLKENKMLMYIRVKEKILNWFKIAQRKTFPLKRNLAYSKTDTRQ